MPNWMECEVRIIGPIDEIARFRTAHIGNDQNGELQLDFDSIIPMPLELRDTNAAPSDVFIWALGGDLYASRSLSRRLGYETADATPLNWTWVRGASARRPRDAESTSETVLRQVNHVRS